MRVRVRERNRMRVRVRESGRGQGGGRKERGCGGGTCKTDSLRVEGGAHKAPIPVAYRLCVV